MSKSNKKTTLGIGAIFRDVERRAINSSSTYEPNNDILINTRDVQSLADYVHRNIPGLQSQATTMEDRTNHAPRHVGRNILPASPFFNRLLRFAHAVPPRLCVRDVNLGGKEFTHIQLLSDALAFRERIRSILSPEVVQALDERQEVYVAILAPGGYEYTVAVVAALALGAAIVPMTVQLPAEEAVYFATKSRAACVLVSSGAATKLGSELEQLIKKQNPRSTFTSIPISSDQNPLSSLLDPYSIKLSSDKYLSDNAPGVVIFTSGTTGPPKGAVMRRGFIHDTALAVAETYGFGPGSTLLHVLPVHHATGIGINFFPALVSGCLLEFRSGSFSPQWTWERWRQGGITHFSGVPTIYMRMMRFFEQEIAKGPKGVEDEFVRGARGVKVCLCGTSALPKPIADFWTGLLGRKILLRYGGTEMGAIFKVRLGDEEVPDGSVGNVFAGCDVRLLNEDTGAYVPEDQDGLGEVCVKSPAGELFSKYLYDAEATAKAHTADGFYRTGDIARREGTYYFIEGRASIDIIKSGGYKISALDIEREILGLPYVAEVMVVGVADLEFGERVASAVVLKDEQDVDSSVGRISLEKLRQDLRSRLAGYKMPTVLRIIKAELPKSGTGKVVKKILGPQFFPKNYTELDEVEVWSPGKKAKL